MQNHVESSFGSAIWKSVSARWPPTRRPSWLQTWTLSSPVGCYRLNIRPSPVPCNLEVDTHLLSLGGWKAELTQALLSVCCVFQWFSWKHRTVCRSCVCNYICLFQKHCSRYIASAFWWIGLPCCLDARNCRHFVKHCVWRKWLSSVTLAGVSVTTQS